ncbi:S8 family serine peptidase [Corallococcus exiguus]|uniref:S8 family serine peptidase n=3 Tax=Corallococcus exiguus TaxID=83462 RepID=A0A7X4YIA0_9BACT|nr:S8 family serine peptidase [Corallococcus exiguus]NBC45909.1 S8 family serine peptidase [Corallococcus exiguus]
MKKSVLSVLLSSLLLNACGAEVPAAPVATTAAPIATQTAPSKNPRRFVPGQAIVKFKGSDRALTDAELPPVRGFRAQLVQPLSSGAVVVSLEAEARSAATSIAEEEARTLEAIAELRRNPDVEYAHENLYMEFFATPTDPLYSQQWNYPAINLPTAWNSVTGNVKIAVLDTGRLDHPDLSGAWTTGYDFGQGDADPYDTNTYHHGLHVAGILAARTNNGIGGAGVCWGCQLMPVKVSTASNGVLLSAVDDAIRYAADNGARVINMSFGTAYNPNAPAAVYPCTNYPDIQSAVTYAVGKGVVVVAAGGNDGVAGLLTANITPASCTGVIAVGASTQTGARAPWSSGGSRVDVIAPGGTASAGFYGQGIGCPADPNTADPYSGTDQVLSAWAIGKPGATLLAGDYCHRYLSGTSMSSPHVAGLAALILSQKPSMTPAQVTARIKSTATAVSGCGSNCGTGRINAAAAVYTNLPPRPDKGPWYNPARSGNGLDIQHLASDQIHVTWYTYTSAGVPIWYQAYLFAEPGEWRGDLLKTTWTGSSATLSVVGTMRITYSSGLWRFYWTLGSLSGNEPIQFLAFGSGSSVMNLNGLWYNGAEPGWGTSFNTQGNTHVVNLTVYQGSNPVWLQGVVSSTSTSLSFPMAYITGTNLCPGCTGTTSTSATAAGTFTVNGSAGSPIGMAASSAVSFPGGTWNRPSFTLNRLTGP